MVVFLLVKLPGQVNIPAKVVINPDIRAKNREKFFAPGMMVKKRRKEVSSEGLRESFETLAQLLVAGGELGTALLEELDGAGSVARQVVDVAVGRLHLGQDAFQFGDGLGVCGCLRFHVLVLGFIDSVRIRVRTYFAIAVELKLDVRSVICVYY